MSGAYNPYWQPYGFAPGARPVFVPPHPESYPNPAEFPPHATAPPYPFYPVHDVGLGGDAHPGMVPGLSHLDVPQERKHRRSRNGCFTCRTRRVKCDEKRPACDRCRKGCRECVYPTANEAPKKKSKSATSSSGAQAADDDDDDEGSASPPSSSAAPDLVRDTASEATYSTASPSVSPNQPEHKKLPKATQAHVRVSRLSSSPRESPGTTVTPTTPLSTLIEAPGTSKTHLFYLEYSRTKITYHHYGVSVPAPQLIPGFLFHQARQFKPLLHAVTAYAAYHYSLAEDEASLKDFIWHYAESVSDLRGYLLETKSAVQLPVLLTILQLATIEEYLGDWVNLIHHYMAATKVLTSLFSPDNVMREQLGREILDWHNHFDLFSSYIGGKGLSLGIEWYEARHQYNLDRLREEPDNIQLLNSERHTRLHVLGAEIANYFKELTSGTLSEKTIEKRAGEFQKGIFDILGQLGPLKNQANRALSKPCPPEALDPSEMGSPLLTTSDEAGNPWDSVEYYVEPLWSTNFLILRAWGCYTMLLSHLLPQTFWKGKEASGSPGSASSPSSSSGSGRSPRATLSNPLGELRIYCIKMCQLYAAISNHDPDPGSIMGAQAGLSFASCFIGPLTSHPTAPQHIRWCREQLMRVENRGYIFPMGMRKRMSEAWGVDVNEWWFPEGQGLSDTIRAVREFVVYRTRPAEDDLSEDVREMNGLFSAMVVGEDSGSATDGEDEGPDVN